jgi:hypothetical protein
MGAMITTLCLRGSTGHGLHLVVHLVLQGDEWVFHLRVIGWTFLTPLFSKWHNTNLIHFVLTLVMSRLLTLALDIDFVGGMHGGLLVDQLRLLWTHDQILKDT